MWHHLLSKNVQEVVKQVISGGSGAIWCLVLGCVGVLMTLVVCFVVSELGPVVIDRLVNNDITVTWGGLRCGTGILKMSWGEVGCLGGLLVHCQESFGRWGCSVKGTMYFNEHIFSSLHNVIIWATDSPYTLFMA